MDELQKQETRNKKNKDVYEKLKVDIRMLRDEAQALQRALEPKVIITFRGVEMMRNNLAFLSILFC